MNRFVLAALTILPTLAACTDSPALNPELGDKHVLLFGMASSGQPVSHLTMGQPPEEICLWRYDGDDQDPLDDDEPAFYLDGYALISTNPDVATFAVAGEGADSACITTTVVGPGTTTLRIGRQDMDHIQIVVEQPR